MKKLSLIVFRWLLLSSVISAVIGLIGEALPKPSLGENAMGQGLLMIALWLLCMIATLVWAIWTRPSESISLSNKRDLFLLSAGILSASVIAMVVMSTVNESRQYSQRQAEIARVDASRDRARSMEIQQDWAKGSWRGSLPLCVAIEDKGLNNQCPGSLSLTYCWKMDADKDWGLRSTDCALGERASITVATGFYAMPVPWCRAWGICRGELQVLDAVVSRSP